MWITCDHTHERLRVATIAFCVIGPQHGACSVAPLDVRVVFGHLSMVRVGMAKVIYLHKYLVAISHVCLNPLFTVWMQTLVVLGIRREVVVGTVLVTILDDSLDVRYDALMLTSYYAAGLFDLAAVEGGSTEFFFTALDDLLGRGHVHRPIGMTVLLLAKCIICMNSAPRFVSLGRGLVDQLALLAFKNPLLPRHLVPSTVLVLVDLDELVLVQIGHVVDILVLDPLQFPTLNFSPVPGHAFPVARQLVVHEVVLSVGILEELGVGIGIVNFIFCIA